MIIRAAKFVDIANIIVFLEKQLERSHYATEHAGKVDVATAKQFLMNAIASQGVRSAGGCIVKLLERTGSMCGFMAATLQPVYLIGNRLCATNLFWVVSEGARPTDGPLLLIAMLEWAKQAGCIEAKCDTTGIIADPEKAGRLLERTGFKLYSHGYRIELTGVSQ